MFSPQARQVTRPAGGAVSELLFSLFQLSQVWKNDFETFVLVEKLQSAALRDNLDDVRQERDTLEGWTRYEDGHVFQEEGGDTKRLGGQAEEGADSAEDDGTTRALRGDSETSRQEDDLEVIETGHGEK